MWHVTVIALITLLAPQYGVDTQEALAIAECESQYGKYEYNWEGSSAKGVYQFTDTTWWYIEAEGSQLNEFENIKQFMIWYPVHPEWWECYNRLYKFTPRKNNN